MEIRLIRKRMTTNTWVVAGQLCTFIWWACLISEVRNDIVCTAEGGGGGGGTGQQTVRTGKRDKKATDCGANLY